MSVCIDYKDTVTIIEQKYNKYGSESIKNSYTVKCLFMQNTGWSHSNNNAEINSDASLLIDPSDTFVKENANRLEGMLVVANPFGYSAAESWYRITNVSVNQDKLLCNEIDNISASLKKTESINNGV